MAVLERAIAWDKLARQGLIKGRPPVLSGADRRIAEYAAKQLNDVPTLADLASIGQWEAVTRASIRRELANVDFIGWYIHSRLAYHRPDLLPYFVEEARKVGIELAGHPADPIEWLRPALNVFALSAAQLADIQHLYDPPSADHWLANVSRVPTIEDAKMIALSLAMDYWPYLDPREIKPTLIRADSISQEIGRAHV